MFFHFSSTGRGRAADPETINLPGKPKAALASDDNNLQYNKKSHYFKIHDKNHSWGLEFNIVLWKELVGYILECK